MDPLSDPLTGTRSSKLQKGCCKIVKWVWHIKTFFEQLFICARASNTLESEDGLAACSEVSNHRIRFQSVACFESRSPRVPSVRERLRSRLIYSWIVTTPTSTTRRPCPRTGSRGCRWRSSAWGRRARQSASASSWRSSGGTRRGRRTSRRSGPARISTAPGRSKWSRGGCKNWRSDLVGRWLLFKFYTPVFTFLK